ncbi:MAG TPA: hypothetical protein VJX23_01485 [Candidatus Binataceae bacterium]|nr:hypothetical protein [Candidatus Binataceae bacterium]
MLKITVIDMIKTARTQLLPIICCITASLVLGFAPFFYGRQQTGDWSAPNQLEIDYYLQIAARPYFDHVPYLTDPSVPDGPILFPWLQYIPAVYFAREFGLNVFSLTVGWTLFASVAMAGALYGLFRYFLRWRWLAGGLTIIFLADSSGTDYHPFVRQIGILLAALINPAQSIDLELFQYRLVNPAVVFPFIFLHILAVAAARNRSNRLRTWISGATFALLCYVYFYAWTMVAAALCLAFLIDNRARGLYAKTLAIGFAAGAPLIVHDTLVQRAFSREAEARFGLFAAPRGWPESYYPLHHYDMILIPCLFGGLIAWLLVSRNYQMIYLWCLAVAGFVLSFSSWVTGVYLHDYHWQWLARPMLAVLLCMVAATVVTGRLRLSPALTRVWSIAVVLFFLTGLYVSTLGLRTDPDLRAQLRGYAQYKAQRLEGNAAALDPGAMIGGDDRFCDLAVAGEGVRDLAGWTLYVSMAVDNTELYARYGLNQYLAGVTDRNQFKATFAAALRLVPRDEELEQFVRVFDEVSNDPRKFLDAYHVRYAALRTDQPTPSYLKDGWILVQHGPYWQIWQRTAAN